MDDAKLPDLSRLRDVHNEPKKLPPQTSAEDTSNWDDRAFSAPHIEVNREVVFEIPDVTELVVANPLLEQERVKSVIRAKRQPN
jgi:hypothetical protein